MPSSRKDKQSKINTYFGTLDRKRKTGRDEDGNKKAKKQKHKENAPSTGGPSFDLTREDEKTRSTPSPQPQPPRPSLSPRRPRISSRSVSLHTGLHTMLTPKSLRRGAHANIPGNGHTHGTPHHASSSRGQTGGTLPTPPPTIQSSSMRSHDPVIDNQASSAPDTPGEHDHISVSQTPPSPVPLGRVSSPDRRPLYNTPKSSRHWDPTTSPLRGSPSMRHQDDDLCVPSSQTFVMNSQVQIPSLVDLLAIAKQAPPRRAYTPIRGVPDRQEFSDDDVCRVPSSQTQELIYIPIESRLSSLPTRGISTRTSPDDNVDRSHLHDSVIPRHDGPPLQDTFAGFRRPTFPPKSSDDSESQSVVPTSQSDEKELLIRPIRLRKSSRSPRELKSQNSPRRSDSRESKSMSHQSSPAQGSQRRNGTTSPNGITKSHCGGSQRRGVRSYPLAASVRRSSSQRVSDSDADSVTESESDNLPSHRTSLRPSERIKSVPPHSSEDMAGSHALDDGNPAEPHLSRDSSMPGISSSGLNLPHSLHDMIASEADNSQTESEDEDGPQPPPRPLRYASRQKPSPPKPVAIRPGQIGSIAKHRSQHHDPASQSHMDADDEQSMESMVSDAPLQPPSSWEEGSMSPSFRQSQVPDNAAVQEFFRWSGPDT